MPSWSKHLCQGYGDANDLQCQLEDYEFVFVNGMTPTKPADEDVGRMFDEHYGYILDGLDINLCKYLVSKMIRFVEANGPFHGVLGFSEGGIFTALLLIGDALRPFAGFRCGILFSTAPPFDPDIWITDGGELRCVSAVEGALINVPKAHIQEANPPSGLWRLSPLVSLWAKHGMGSTVHLNEAMIGLCRWDVREVFTHHGVGHDIPSARSNIELYGELRAIERTIERCQDI